MSSRLLLNPACSTSVFEVAVPAMIAASDTARKIQSQGGSIRALINPSLDQSHGARTYVQKLPSGIRHVELHYPDLGSLSNEVINKHELRHLGEEQGLVDPLIRSADGSYKPMSLLEYMVRRAEAECKAEFASSPEDSQRRREARKEYRKFRQISCRIAGRELPAEKKLEYLGTIKASLPESYIQNFESDYSYNVNRNPLSDNLRQVSDAKKSRTQKRAQKLKAKKDKKEKFNKKKSLYAVRKLMAEQRAKNLSILMNDQEFRRFFPVEERSIKFTRDFSARLHDGTVSISNQEYNPDQDLKLVDSFMETGYQVKLNSPKSTKDISVLTKPGCQQRTDEIGTILAKFIAHINKGLEVQGPGLIHAYKRHCHRISKDLSSVLNSHGQYVPAYQFARPVSQTELLGLLRIAAEKIYQIVIEPKTNATGMITLLAHVPTDFALGTDCISMTFREDGKLVSVQPFGKSGNYPLLGLIPFDIKKNKPVSYQQAGISEPKKRQSPPQCLPGFELRPTLVVEGVGQHKIWTLVDEIKHLKIFNSFFESR